MPKAGHFFAGFEWMPVVEPAGPWKDIGLAPPEPGTTFANVINDYNSMGIDIGKSVDILDGATLEQIGTTVVEAAVSLLAKRLTRLGPAVWPRDSISLIFLGISLPSRP